MSHSKEYDDYVLKDLKKYAGLMHPVKASLIERLIVRKVKIQKLHPNPEDEFSMPDIGPNYRIVQDYVQRYLKLRTISIRPTYDMLVDPLTVEKVKPNGYMLLNGHHRWLAAHVLNDSKMEIRIVNITHESEILRAMRSTQNKICVSFDLDEVILAEEGSEHTEKKPLNPLVLGCRERIREGVPALIDALHRMGCDIWVYTGSYASEKYIRTLLRPYHVHVDGVVNGMKNRKTDKELSVRFRERYEVSVHVDTESVTCVDTKSKNYEMTDLRNGPSVWASEAIGIIRGTDMVKKALQ